MSRPSLSESTLLESTHRELCLRCRRAKSACWCHAVTPCELDVRVLLLQHPRESRNPIGTARMAHLGLQGSTLLQGVRFDAEPRFHAALDEPGRKVCVLYPASGAVPLETFATDGEPLTLVVIDGTWAQARSVYNKNPRLRALPAVRLAPSAPSRYRIRREPADHCLSTIEAIAAALRALRGEAFEPETFLRPFDAMVERQLEHIESQRNPRHAISSRHRKKTKAPRPWSPPPELTIFGRNLVLVHGEGNGFPAFRDDGPRVSLAQWLAVRPATGERFHAFVRPETGLPPEGLRHLELGAHDFDGAMSPMELARAWAAFREETDVLCPWTYFPLRLLRDAGGDPSPFVILQRLASERLCRRLGRVESAHEALGLPPVEPVAPGRGGLRLSMLEALAKRLQEPPHEGFGVTPSEPL